MIETQYLQPSPRLEVDLLVTTEGMKLTVQRGKFRVMGQIYRLREDQEITFEPSSEPVSVQGHLALDRDTNEPFLLVDEVPEVNGSFDHYEWGETGPKALHTLFVINIPPGTASLDNVPVKVFLRKERTDG
jgi:hypothetical protein